MSNSRDGFTRRQVIVGTGAAIASMGVVSLGSSRATAAGHWDHDTDILVVGTGVGAATAAVIAHENGDAVMVVEKAPVPGGTSAKSAGVLWVPDNFTLRAKGIDDKKDDCLRYMARYSYPERYDSADDTLGLTVAEFSLLEAFYDNASKAVEELHQKDALKVAEWRMFALDRSATDYLDNVPENKVPAGRALGPLKSDGTTGLGGDMMAQLWDAMKQRGIPVHFNHAAMRLVMNEDNRVVGLEAESAGKVVTLRARKAVIFATGGYVHNPEFTSYYQRNRLYGSCAMPFATGDFINIAGAAGARMGNMGGAWRTQVLLEEALKSPLLGSGVFFPPGDSMLQVNKYGKRVVNEKRNYNDRTEAHGTYDSSRAEYPNQLLFMIYDQRSAEAFAGAYPLPASPDGSNHVLKGRSIKKLSAKIEHRLKEIAPHTGGFALSPDFSKNLKTTIDRFNGFARSGKDPDFQRGDAAYDNEWHLVFSPMVENSGHSANKGPSLTMHPLRDKGPYYAMILVAGALDTCGGPAIDASARVLNTEDQPIAGLYGAGNCISSPSKDAYWGAGHTLALSLTFGYIAANAAHGEPRDQS